MTTTDTLRIRVEPEFKEGITRMYQQRGTTVSQAVQSFLASKLAAHSIVVDAFDAIMASADAKVEASGIREPTIEEINDCISRVRIKQSEQSLAAS